MIGTEETTKAACKEFGIPEHMHDAVVRYLHKGINPGSFLSAIIENDLKEAVGRADEINLSAIPNYVKFFYNYAPGDSWGRAGTIEYYQSRLKQEQSA